MFTNNEGLKSSRIFGIVTSSLQVGICGVLQLLEALRESQSEEAQLAVKSAMEVMSSTHIVA